MLPKTNWWDIQIVILKDSIVILENSIKDLIVKQQIIWVLSERNQSLGTKIRFQKAKMMKSMPSCIKSKVWWEVEDLIEPIRDQRLIHKRHLTLRTGVNETKRQIKEK